MTKPKNQHWVPRFYLRTFATPETRESSDPQVWIFSTQHGDPQLTNVKNIAAKRFLYSPKTPGGMRDWQMEERLQNIESLLSSVWAKLATDFIDFYSAAARGTQGGSGGRKGGWSVLVAQLRGNCVTHSITWHKWRVDD
jgi:hypothetical protein